MLYSEFKGLELSRLGLGTMRFPVKENGDVDQERVNELVDHAIAGGINYFDTAYAYCGGESEIAIGKALKKYPRDSYYLADKYPGHQVMDHDAERVFKEQLAKCGVDYFDFYLLHNVSEFAMDVYLDKKLSIPEYFIRKREEGVIKHLGFSSHATPQCLEDFLKLYGSEMEFCQIQFNYLDWSLQEAEKKLEILDRYNIPVWVMEPARGGKLTSLSPENEARLKALRPDESTASWAMRWNMHFPQVKVVLSGMVSEEVMDDNIKTFSEDKALSDKEISTLYEIAETLKDSVPCTGCRYCTSSCPMGLDIPTLISACNDYRFFAGNVLVTALIEALPDSKKPDQCIGCESCVHMCPQGIQIPEILKELSERYEKAPKWSDVCVEREEAVRKRHEKKED